MPGLNHTGPQGQGPRTGRQMGKCASADKNTANNDAAPGKGKGRGRGRAGKGLGAATRFGQQNG